jgi:hypothetical protein
VSRLARKGEGGRRRLWAEFSEPAGSLDRVPVLYGLQIATGEEELVAKPKKNEAAAELGRKD